MRRWVRMSFMLLIVALSPGCEFRIDGLGNGGPTADLLSRSTDFAGAIDDLSPSNESDSAGTRDGAMTHLSPTVTSTAPFNGASKISVGKKPTATFDNVMDPSTITALTFTLKQGAMSISGIVVFDGQRNIATFTPAAPLGAGLLYTATITTGAKSLEHAPLVADHVWTFTTGACSQATVVLGSAANFAVLAYSTVTNTGLTTITGDLGLSPGSSVTGSPTVIGTQHVADAIAAKGIADLTTAYNDAQGRTLCATTVAGDIGGQTLTPGLYKSISSLAISSGDLTLDAQDDSDAVFIFQMTTSLTTAATYKVVLTRGAKAANIFWQVGTAPSFAATSAFKGTLLAHDAVSLGAGATLDGRALSWTAAVNLDTNRIGMPAP